MNAQFIFNRYNVLMSSIFTTVNKINITLTSRMNPEMKDNNGKNRSRTIAISAIPIAGILVAAALVSGFAFIGVGSQTAVAQNVTTGGTNATNATTMGGTNATNATTMGGTNATNATSAGGANATNATSAGGANQSSGGPLGSLFGGGNKSGSNQSSGGNPLSGITQGLKNLFGGGGGGGGGGGK